jgi:hypothetical protein
LDGGINTYGYAYQNSLRYIDFEGLEVGGASDRGEALGNILCAGVSAYAIRTQGRQADQEIENFEASLPACVKGCSLKCTEYRRHQSRWCIARIYAANSMGSCKYASVATSSVVKRMYSKTKCSKSEKTGGGMCCAE